MYARVYTHLHKQLYMRPGMWIFINDYNDIDINSNNI